MTQTIEALSRRMSTLQSIRGIVHTMKTLSAVNATPYERAANAIEAYHATIIEGLQIFAYSTHGFELPVPDRRAPKIALIFGSDHGLCGGYNEAVARAALDGGVSRDWHILAVGAQMDDALTGLGFCPVEMFTPPASVDGIGRLAGEILISLDQHRARAPNGELSVTMFHMQRDKRGLQSPAVRNLLPLEPNFLIDLERQPWKSRSLPVVTIEPNSIFAALIRNHLFAVLFGATVEAMATENAARLALMQKAERAINDHYDEMLLAIRSARQSEITSELLDVIVGFEALRQSPSRQ